jgi:hypothetical protein
MNDGEAASNGGGGGEPAKSDGGESAPMETVRGTILRRRSMGRELAFADVLAPVTEEEAGAPSSSAAAAVEKKSRKKVEVIFRRQSFQGDAFPTKNAMLPYGASVELQVRPHGRTNRAAQDLWEVVHYRVLWNPREAAREAAQLDGGGTSSTDYLRLRNEVFEQTEEAAQRLRGPGATAPARPDRKGRGGAASGGPRTPAPKPRTPAPKLRCSDDGRRGRGGNEASRSARARIFASWLVENLLDVRGGGEAVLDVAGGKGHLSAALAARAGIGCLVMDPLVRRGRRGGVGRSAERRLRRLGAPVPQVLHRHFVNYENRDPNLNGDDDVAKYGSDFRSVLDDHTCLVGLHPDQCTEDILDAALQHNKSVAIVPCCVFPTLFPTRTLKGTGKVVQSYEDFLQYLLEKDPRLRKATLPFEGKNQVIYLKVQPGDTTAAPVSR